jgi:hypothetical protein
MKLLDAVALTKDLPEQNLYKGQVGQLLRFMILIPLKLNSLILKEKLMHLKL